MWRNVVLAALGATGFALLFGIKRTKMGFIFVASGVAWYGYEILCRSLKKEEIAMYIVTVMVVLFAKILTLFVDGSVMKFTTPILIPFIPGATLYYVMRDLLNQSREIILDMESLVEQLGAMVLGIISAEIIIVVVEKIKKHY